MDAKPRYIPITFLRNEDAERDSTIVLSLSKNNVKALFRRAQARIALGRLLDAQKGNFLSAVVVLPTFLPRQI